MKIEWHFRAGTKTIKSFKFHKHVFLKTMTNMIFKKMTFFSITLQD